jgi:hypothetical protein
MLYFSLENEESKPFRQRLTSVGVSPFGFGKNVNLVFDDEGTAFLESRGDFLACYTKDGIVHRLAEGKTGRQILHVMAFIFRMRLFHGRTYRGIETEEQWLELPIEPYRFRFLCDIA